MQSITSLQNPLIKTVHALHQKKNRRETGLFIIEGFKGVDGALEYGLEVEHLFLSEKQAGLANKYPEDRLYLLNDKIMKKISTTDSPCEILAVAKQFEYRVDDLLKEENPLIIVLENIKDPGNLGTIIRTVKAANVSGLILTGDTADIFNPKTVRSTAANLWKIPIINLEKEVLRETLSSKKDFQFIATAVSKEKSKSFFEINYKLSTVIMFGSEAEGLSDELLKQADFFAEIPMNKEIESLNLSVSVGILAYEAYKQRENKKNN